MCAIAGFYGFRNDNLIKKISQQMSHRGPDGEGLYVDDQTTLLNRRLAIIDIAGGNQPIYNEDKSIIVVYNGEIYNYRELRGDLEKKGHVFKTKSDTEVIVHGYEQWGEQCFDRFNGMFAIALYDKKKKKLILARDHFGIKPLYYAFRNEPNTTSQVVRGLIFSSEIKPIFYSGLIKQKPNDRIIYRYLRYRIHDDQKETFFDGIYKLMPGEMLTISQKSKVKSQKFSNLEEELLRHSGKRSASGIDSGIVEKFRKELIKAITYRLIADVPVGTCLSGGLDSSSVAAIVNKLLQQHVRESQSVGKRQNTFSAVFPGLSNDEERYINEVIKFIKLESYKVKPQPEEFFAEIRDFVRTQEEPTISTGPYPQFQVMREAAKHVKVLLDGQGADEMMAGYMPYYFVYLRQLWKEKNYPKLIKETWGMSDVLIKYSIRTKQSINSEGLINRKFLHKFSGEKYKIVKDDLKKRLVQDIFHNSLPSLLRYEDRNSMRFSIEGRVPFLDVNLLKYIFSLSDEAIIKDGWNKFILRQATRDLLPELINKRRNKIGFTAPENAWFMRMKNRIYQIFLSESFARRPYFNQPAVLKAFQQFIEGKNDDTMLFWRLLNLELWLREFFDSKPVRKLASSRVSELKKRNITVESKTYERYPIKTDLFKNGDDIPQKIANNLTIQQFNHSKWFVVVSEKIVAIAQGRSHFIWDIKPSFWAKTLVKFVTKTPYGIGLGSPWTMQLAIDEVGLGRILFASLAAVATKPLGIKGAFYNIAGETVRSIDGPTEYSLYPSNVSAKLGPKDPQKVTEEIHHEIENRKLKTENFLGVAIIDANDIGQNVLGNSTPLPNTLIEKIFLDNPMGQANEQTPIVVVQLLHEKK